MMPTVARVVDVNAAATGAGAACRVQRGGDLAGARGDVALAPTAFERRLDRGQGQAVPWMGLGARSSTPSASPWARSSKAASAAG